MKANGTVMKSNGTLAYKQSFVTVQMKSTTNASRRIAVQPTPNRRPLMSESYTLPTKPEGIVATLRERFNTGKVSAMMGLYAPEAVFIAKDGRTITDHRDRRRTRARSQTRPAAGG